MANLQRAIEIAVAAHAGQTTKNGDPYILHPLAVMSMLYTHEEKIVGVLHDVIEDTTIDDLLAEGFDDNVIGALEALNHIKGIPYDEYIEIVAQNILAVKVKLADLKHNMDVSRLHPPIQEYFRKKMFDKYIPAYQRLKQVLDEHLER